jgi:hypothetical protein
METIMNLLWQLNLHKNFHARIYLASFHLQQVDFLEIWFLPKVKLADGAKTTTTHRFELGV